jgi:hypothetical protein
MTRSDGQAVSLDLLEWHVACYVALFDGWRPFPLTDVSRAVGGYPEAIGIKALRKQV